MDSLLLRGPVLGHGQTSLLIEDGRISELGARSSPREPIEAAPDELIAPGFIDLQVNGFAAHDAALGHLDALGRALARRGTTSWCPTLCSQPLEWYGRWFAEHPDPAPGEIGLHLEGPFLVHPGAHPVRYLRPPDTAWLAALPERVRIVTLAPELPGGLDAIALLAARGIVASLGHTDADYDLARAAADAGASMVTHVFNGMAPLHHRSPGIVGAALTEPRLVPGVIGDGVHVHPAVLRLILETRPAALVSDSVATTGLIVAPEPSGTAVARLPDGTIAGSVIALADAVCHAVRAGVPLGTALLAATATPASVVGRPDIGALAAGCRADIVSLDVDLSVRDVWVEGSPIL